MPAIRKKARDRYSYRHSHARTPWIGPFLSLPFPFAIRGRQGNAWPQNDTLPQKNARRGEFDQRFCVALLLELLLEPLRGADAPELDAGALRTDEIVR